MNKISVFSLCLHFVLYLQHPDESSGSKQKEVSVEIEKNGATTSTAII
jgi:hypothetical protein